MGMITLRQLRDLFTLAKHGYFGRAAVTQPALSMQIRDLEVPSGVAVVERRPAPRNTVTIRFRG